MWFHPAPDGHGRSSGLHLGQCVLVKVTCFPRSPWVLGGLSSGRLSVVFVSGGLLMQNESNIQFILQHVFLHHLVFSGRQRHLLMTLHL